MPTRPGYTDEQDAAIGRAYEVMVVIAHALMNDESHRPTIADVEALEAVVADLIAAPVDPSNDPDGVWGGLWSTIGQALDRADSDDLQTLLRGLLPITVRESRRKLIEAARAAGFVTRSKI